MRFLTMHARSPPPFRLYHTSSFLDAFAKLRKMIISFIMSVPISVHTEQFSSYWKVFHDVLYLRIF